MFSSESVALDALGYSSFIDVHPGKCSSYVRCVFFSRTYPTSSLSPTFQAKLSSSQKMVYQSGNVHSLVLLHLAFSNMSTLLVLTLSWMVSLYIELDLPWVRL